MAGFFSDAELSPQSCSSLLLVGPWDDLPRYVSSSAWTILVLVLALLIVYLATNLQVLVVSALTGSSGLNWA